MKDLGSVFELAQRTCCKLHKLRAYANVVLDDDHGSELVEHPRHCRRYGLFETKIRVANKGGNILGPVDAMQCLTGLAHTAMVVGVSGSRSVDCDTNNLRFRRSQRIYEVADAVGSIEAQKQHRYGLHLDSER